MKSKLIIPAIALTYLCTSNSNARITSSGDVLGRDMDVPGIGKIGHLALGTGNDVFLPTNITIEAEPQTPAIVFGTVKDFKQATRYWGSRWGIVSSKSNVYDSLVEAKHQSFWCPKYTPFTVWITGQGFFDGPTQRPIPTQCGMFRCDTFVGYIASKAGSYAIINNVIKLPYNAFMTYPYANIDLFQTEKVTPELSQIDQKFIALSSDDIKKMTFEEFSIIASPSEENTSMSHIEKEWELISNEDVSTIWRNGFIDRRALAKEGDTLTKMIELYGKIPNKEVQNHLIIGIMYYYQSHWEKVSNSAEYETIKLFFQATLKNSMNKEVSENIVRGYIDFHDEWAIKANMPDIKRHLKGIHSKSLLGLKMELAKKSSGLETTFIPEIIQDLKNKDNPDLNSMFFYMINKNFINIGNPASVEAIKLFTEETLKKYKAKLFEANANQDLDTYHAMTSKSDILDVKKKFQ
ncbi:MAG: hypothetical protein H0U75_06165 [Legionella sp.]|nr:hypothetical protein [Legionella sp.]